MNKTFESLAGRRTAILASLAITAVLAIPFLTMAPDENASTEPSGDVFTARDLIDDKFVSSVHASFVIVEHDSGDLLRSEPLAELLKAEEELRSDPELGGTLYSYFEVEAEVPVVGVLTFADLVDSELIARGHGGVAEATDEQVKAVGADLIDRHGERNSLLGLSAASSRTAAGEWIIPGLLFQVLSDDTQLGFGNLSVVLGGDTDVEEYDRDVQEVLRTATSFQVNGVAIDANLTAAEQGAIAGPFIGITILAVLLLVGLTFRSYWVMATIGVAFLLLIVWLKGASNLIGLKDDLVLSLIVPVAMVSFGVDFAFHAVGRYREERATGKLAQPAVVAGMTAVSGALLLALLSDTAAFLANLTSGIESINQFGIGAAIALGSAYLLLGVVTPFVVAKIEATVPPPGPKSGRRVAAAAGAAAMTMTSVLLLVFILPWLGLVMTAMTTVATVLVPYRVQKNKAGTEVVGNQTIEPADNRLARPIGAAIVAVARRRKLVLPLALVITSVSAIFAFSIPAEFDVEDFFASDTDFVVGLDQLDTHVGDRGGEPARFYVEGDLTDPTSLTLLSGHIESLKALDSPSLARNDDGVTVEGGVFSVFDATWESTQMPGLVLEQTGVALSDDNADGIPDTREQVEALLSVASLAGVPFDATSLILTPDDVNTSISLDGEAQATVFGLALVNSRAQESVAQAKDALEPIAAAISEDLDGSFVQVTGSPFVREASLDATNRALQISLPIALLLCLVISSAFLRSLRYGVASIVPIIMVVAWLYAFMERTGYAINLVTATIAAVSIGIGIDFAIHFIVRYREELSRHGSRETAVRATGEGTGVALVASALSSAVGFGILAFAPMPLFAAYGLLTALMIVMALVATLIVLPGVLVSITRDTATGAPCCG